jgi:ABC-type Fe3+/spermidine/putrescine transport system ATPase subunit
MPSCVSRCAPNSSASSGTRLPILYVTHDQTEALAMSDRIAVMSQGRVHQLDTPSEIYSRPATRFVLDFIGSVNYLPCKVEACENGLVSLSVPGSGRIQVPRPERVPEGSSAELAVRPEDLILLSGEEEGLAARVELRSFLGESFEYHLRVGDCTVRARTEKGVDFPEGAPVRLQARAVHLLDAAQREGVQELR